MRAQFADKEHYYKAYTQSKSYQMSIKKWRKKGDCSSGVRIRFVFMTNKISLTFYIQRDIELEERMMILFFDFD